MADIIGSINTDFLVGTTNADFILGEGGADLIRGEGGNDRLFGGLQADQVIGAAGNDFLSGDVGNDVLYGDNGNDTLVGGASVDQLFGDAGDDRLSGNDGIDILYGGEGTDTLVGGSKRDFFVLTPGLGGDSIETADRIQDFQQIDIIQLAGDLKFSNLRIRNEGNGVSIQDRRTGEYLAFLPNTPKSRVARSRFRRTSIPVRDNAVPTFDDVDLGGNVTTAGGTSQTFTIQYGDAQSLDIRSLGDRDIRVTGPNGFSQFATLVNVARNSRTAATATYRIPAPGGSWDATDDGTYTVTLRNAEVFDQGGNFISGTSLGTFEADVPPPIVPVSVTVRPSSVVEDGGSSITYTITRTGFLRDPLTVNFSLSGTAQRGVDYTTVGGIITDDRGNITLPAGIASGVIVVTPLEDNLDEPNETVILNLQNGRGYSIDLDRGSATGQIIDDEAVVTLEVSPEVTVEDSGVALVYTFTRSGFIDRPVTVNFSVAGTATFGATNDYQVSVEPGTTFDFSNNSGSVLFAAGEETKVLRLVPNADNVLEPNETIALTLEDGTGYTPGTTTQVRGTITNDETAVSVAVSPEDAPEDSATDLVFTFTRDGFLSEVTLVQFAIAGTATFGGDGADYTVSSDSSTFTFNGTTGTIAFGPGSAAQTVRISPNADSVLELDETIQLTVLEDDEYLVGQSPTATGTIQNDESSLQLFLNPDSVLEDSGDALTYTVVRSGFLDRALIVNFSVGGSAELGSDYTVTPSADLTFGATSGTITFAPNETEQTITLVPVENGVLEGDRTINLTLQSGTGYVLEDTDPVVATIVDDEANVSLNVSSSSVFEDSGNGIVYTFTREGFTDEALTINFTIGGTALQSTGDYTVNSDSTFSFAGTTGTITFAPGSDTATLTILPTSDLLNIEADETVILTLASGNGYGISTPNPAAAIILNDDGIVTNTNDSGAGSLRQAILAANNAASIVNPTITFTSGAAGVISLETALPAIARNMVIDGPGAASLTVSRSSETAFRIFRINNGITTTLRGLEIANGDAGNGNGGGVLNQGGILTIEDSLINGNRALIGGGIYHENGSLTLRRTIVSENRAEGTGGSNPGDPISGAGGGLGIGTGTVNLRDNTVFEDNVSTIAGGGIFNSSGTLSVIGTVPNDRIAFIGNRTAGAGGGIYNSETGTVVVSTATFRGNQAGNILGGGAIFNAGGVVSVGDSIFNAPPLNTPGNITGDFNDLNGNQF